MWIDPILGDRFAFVILFPATIFAYWFGGRGPALLSLVLSLLAADYFFTAPRYAVLSGGLIELFGFVVYAILGGGVILVGESIQRAYRRIEADAAELRAAKDRLETEAAERLASQQRLRESEERFRQLADAMPQFVWTARPDGTIDYCNHRHVELQGLMRNADGSWQWLPAVHPEDRDRTVEVWQQSVRTGEVYQIEHRVCGLDGTYRWHLSRAVPVRDGAGRIVKWFGTSTDIDQQKQVEETLRLTHARFQRLIDSDVVGIVVADGQGHILEANDYYLSLLGFTREDLRQGKVNWRDVTPLEHLPADERSLQELQVRGACTPYEKQYVLADGSRVWVLIGNALLPGPENLIVAFVLNIDERKRVAKELEQATQAAEAANAAKSRFLANVSHELRTPMNAILGMTELALDEPLSASVRDYLTTAKASADALLMLLDEVLDLSRIESGKMELEQIPFSLRSALGETKKIMTVRARQKGLELICDLPDIVPDALVGDALRLRQILVNLVGNAIKFTQRGHVAVRVRLAKQTAEDVLLEFAVEDTGIGIAPENQQRIFAPFVQAETSTTRHHGGTGLGLAISASFVQAMGGRIWVDSQPGRGSTFFFTVRLPCQLTPIADHPALAVSETVDLDRPASRPLRVLLAEDTTANQKLVTYILDKRGHTTEIAGDGQQAVELVCQRPYDVVLMDVQMPVMDGFQATAAIRALAEPQAQLPIVAMTAHAMRGDQQRCLAAGMNAYLPKPINSRELIELVERMANDVGRPTAVANPAAEPSPSMTSSLADRPSVFDLEAAIAQCFGKREVFEELVEYYFEDAPKRLAEIQAGLEAREAGEVARAAHALRGTLAYLRAEHAAALTRRIEQCGQAGDLDAAAAAARELAGEITLLNEALAPHG
jgi:PAS domain S-box-containing protein